MDERLLTIPEAAQILGFKSKTLYQWKWRRRDFPFIKIGRSLRVEERALYEFIESQRLRNDRDDQ